MFSFQPLIATEIFALRPDFRALSVFVEGVNNSNVILKRRADLRAPAKAHAANHGPRTTLMHGGRPIGHLVRSPKEHRALRRPCLRG